MKIFHWGMLNPMTGVPFAFDDANIQWGDPGYYLEPGDPGFVPYSGRGDSTEVQTLDHEAAQSPEKSTGVQVAGAAKAGCDLFSCDIAGANRDDFSVSSGSDAESGDNTMDAVVAEITGIPAEKCAEVLGAYLDQLLACAAGSALAQGIHDLLSICPTSGGRSLGISGLRTFGGVAAAWRSRWTS